MSPANDNLAPNAKALFCAACGSADVNASALTGGEASCNVCSWKGTTEELAAFHFKHELGSDEQVFRQFFLDLRKILSARFAQDLGQMLIKWGFLDAPDAKNMPVVQRHLARYVGAVAKAIAETVVKTRAEIEKETHRAPDA